MSTKYLVVAVIVVLLGLVFLGKDQIGSLMSRSSTQPVSEVTTAPTVTPEAAPATPSAAVEQNIVTLTVSGYLPASLTVKAGATVTFMNKSGSKATVNSAPHPVHTNYPPLNLGSFADGGVLTLTFGKPGTYGYHNHLNPSQTGKIIVQ